MNNNFVTLLAFWILFNSLQQLQQVNGMLVNYSCDYCSVEETIIGNLCLTCTVYIIMLDNGTNFLKMKCMGGQWSLTSLCHHMHHSKYTSAIDGPVSGVESMVYKYLWCWSS